MVAEKQKCPLCDAQVINLSRHLVLNHNIKNPDDLQSKLARPITPKKPNRGNMKLQPIITLDTDKVKLKPIRPITINKLDTSREKRPQPITNSLQSNRKNIITTAFKVQNEKVARTKIKYIQRMGRLIIGSNEENIILNEGVIALLSCLNHPSKLVRQQTILELENILADGKINSEIEMRIRSSIK